MRVWNLVCTSRRGVVVEGVYQCKMSFFSPKTDRGITTATSNLCQKFQYHTIMISQYEFETKIRRFLFNLLKDRFISTSSCLIFKLFVCIVAVLNILSLFLLLLHTSYFVAVLSFILVNLKTSSVHDCHAVNCSSPCVSNFKERIHW